MTPAEIQDPSLFDAIAELLPAHLREHFYRRMAHLRQLAPNDDILHIAEAMGFLALVIRETPALIADERQRFDSLLAGSVHSVRDALDAATAYHHLLDARLQKLPDEIQAGIDPDIIAAKLIESLRQQFAQTGLPALAQEIAIHATTLTAASKQLSSALLQFSDPNAGACHRLQTAFSSMHADLNNAADHVRSLTRTLRQELITALVVLCVGAGVIGFLLGNLYAHSH
jgi:hypothetical protein